MFNPPPPPYQERGFYRYIFPDLYPFRIWDQQEHNIPWPFTLLGMYSLTFVDIIYIYIYICGNPTSYKLVQKGVICGRVGKKAGNIFGKNLSPPSDLTQIWNFQLLFFFFNPWKPGDKMVEELLRRRFMGLLFHIYPSKTPIKYRPPPPPHFFSFILWEVHCGTFLWNHLREWNEIRMEPVSGRE